MKALAIPRKVGGSLVVTLPKEIVKAEGLVEDVAVEIDVKKEKIDGFGLFPGLCSFNSGDRMQDRDI